MEDKIYPRDLMEDHSDNPKVSVVMPTFNRADYLGEAVRMILDQTWRDLELIIVDDQSTDHTKEVAEAFMGRDKRVLYYKPEEKGGITLVLNKGIELSRGRYIQICHDHDIYRPMMIEKMADVLDRNPSILFVNPGRQSCDHEGKPLPARKPIRNVFSIFSKSYRGMNPYLPDFPELTKGDVWLKMMLRHLPSAVSGLSMIRRSALEKFGLFDPEYGACSDVDMWMRLSAVGDVGFKREVLFLSRGREPGHPYGGVINWEIQDEVIRAHLKHPREFYAGLQYVYRKFRRETEIDFSLLTAYFNCFRWRQWDTLKKGRTYLRKEGVFFSRLAGWFL